MFVINVVIKNVIGVAIQHIKGIMNVSNVVIRIETPDPNVVILLIGDE